MSKTEMQSKKHQIRTIHDLHLKDGFLFSKVMSDEAVCKEFLEKLLKIKIESIQIIEAEKTYNLSYENRGSRLDIYVKDDKNQSYCIEMQAKKRGNLEKRSRYYQSNMDLDLIKKGTIYELLPKSYIIFICTFDLYGEGRHIYHFRMTCQENPKIRMEDGAERIFLNTRGKIDDVSDEMKDFLKYVENTTQETADASSGTLSKNAQKRVNAVKNDERWGAEFMTWEEEMQYEKEEAREEGQARVNELFRRLIADQRMEELKRSTVDPTYQNQLLEEYGL